MNSRHAEADQLLNDAATQFNHGRMNAAINILNDLEEIYDNVLATYDHAEYEEVLARFRKGLAIQADIIGQGSRLAFHELATKLRFDMYNVHIAAPCTLIYVMLAQEYMQNNPALESQLAYGLAIYCLFKERDLEMGLKYLNVCLKYVRPGSIDYADICNLFGYAETINPSLSKVDWLEKAAAIYRRQLTIQSTSGCLLDLSFNKRYRALAAHRNSMNASSENKLDAATAFANDAENKIEEALRLHFAAAELEKPNDNPLINISKAETLHIKAVILLRQKGKAQEGLTCLYAARELQQQLRDRTQRSHFMEATTDTSIAGALIEEGDLEKIRDEAIPRLLSALNVQNSLFTGAETNRFGNKVHEDVQKTLTFLSNAYERLEKYELACRYALQAFKMKEITMGVAHPWTIRAEAKATDLYILYMESPGYGAIPISFEELSPMMQRIRGPITPRTASAASPHVELSILGDRSNGRTSPPRAADAAAATTIPAPALRSKF